MRVLMVTEGVLHEREQGTHSSVRSGEMIEAGRLLQKCFPLLLKSKAHIHW